MEGGKKLVRLLCLLVEEYKCRVELGQTITAGIEGVAEIKFPNVKRR